MSVTIVTPAYNCEDTINDVYASLKGVLSKEINWLLVNDCSTDSTLEEIYKIASIDKYVSVISLDVNSGPCIARKFGVSSSSSDYVYLLDSDDYIYKDSFIEFINFATSDGDFDFYYAPIYGVKSKFDFIYNYQHEVCEAKKILKPTDFIKYGFPQPSSILINREFYLDAEVENDLDWGEDFLTYLCFSSKGNGFRWVKPISCYVINGLGRGSKLSLKSRMALSKRLFKHSLENKEKRVDSMVYTFFLSVRHVVSFFYKKVFK
ncbi:TPA: glycosyltransferase family 2 protein [Klebsiella pneumoniae]|nr:glycosyltransferase family 2 protein [Klebsiella pneumoniae]HDQ2700206.1 glycosyltransferase family 2 protein [Klebsiella pneumoniae]